MLKVSANYTSVACLLYLTVEAEGSAYFAHGRANRSTNEIGIPLSTVSSPRPVTGHFCRNNEDSRTNHGPNHYHDRIGQAGLPGEFSRFGIRVILGVSVRVCRSRNRISLWKD